MKKNRKIFMVMLTVLLGITAACGNSSNESSATSDNQAENNPSTPHEKKDPSDENTTESNSKSDQTETDEQHPNEKDETVNNESAKEEDSSTDTGPSLKEEYLKKLNEAEKEVEKMRENPIDDTTFALKKVEGDAYDILDGLLNEIYGVLEEQLPPEKMEQLRKEQREWLDYRDDTAKEASLKYEGGTMEQYEYVRVENNLTEERCFELVEQYMK
ncbi:lysozyme inhibitor LprI family protein [Sediminibacillus massiliensis]|uniref:lysozyme inhibitor LprI family protein n=1 Tax=Sediminibacillus massiliensis TaxID=1926277 RepID=UPI000988775B|nr:lysozyme inhibitor LprI family protein [Sediminibacillus massiliensis]